MFDICNPTTTDAEIKFVSAEALRGTLPTSRGTRSREVHESAGVFPGHGSTRLGKWRRLSKLSARSPLKTAKGTDEGPHRASSTGKSFDEASGRRVRG